MSHDAMVVTSRDVIVCHVSCGFMESFMGHWCTNRNIYGWWDNTLPECLFLCVYFTVSCLSILYCISLYMSVSMSVSVYVYVVCMTSENKKVNSRPWFVLSWVNTTSSSHWLLYLLMMYFTQYVCMVPPWKQHNPPPPHHPCTFHTHPENHKYTYATGYETMQCLHIPAHVFDDTQCIKNLLINITMRNPVISNYFKKCNYENKTIKLKWHKSRIRSSKKYVIK